VGLFYDSSGLPEVTTVRPGVPEVLQPWHSARQSHRPRNNLVATAEKGGAIL
jgi:hypothetical protein